MLLVLGNSTVGIDIGEFINDGGSIASHKVTFIAWDFAGQVRIYNISYL